MFKRYELYHLNFYPLEHVEIVSRYRDSQFQVLQYVCIFSVFLPTGKI